MDFSNLKMDRNGLTFLKKRIVLYVAFASLIMFFMSPIQARAAWGGLGGLREWLSGSTTHDGSSGTEHGGSGTGSGSSDDILPPSNSTGYKSWLTHPASNAWNVDGRPASAVESEGIGEVVHDTVISTIERELAKPFYNIGVYIDKALRSTGADITISGIVMGKVATGTNHWQFDLSDANIYGRIGALIYVGLRAIAMTALIFFVAIGVIKSLLYGDVKAWSGMKEAIIGGVIAMIVMLIMPQIVDWICNARDVLGLWFYRMSAAFSGGTVEGANAEIATTMNLADHYREIYEGDGGNSLPNAIIYLAVAAMPLAWVVNYVKLAITQLVLFGAFPVFCAMGVKDKKTLTNWCTVFITNLFIPAIDLALLLLPSLIVSAIGTSYGESASRTAIDTLNAIITITALTFIIPAREMLLRLLGNAFNVKMGGGLFAAGAAIGSAVKGAADAAGKGASALKGLSKDDGGGNAEKAEKMEDSDGGSKDGGASADEMSESMSRNMNEVEASPDNDKNENTASAGNGLDDENGEGNDENSQGLTEEEQVDDNENEALAEGDKPEDAEPGDSEDEELALDEGGSGQASGDGQDIPESDEEIALDGSGQAAEETMQDNHSDSGDDTTNVANDTVNDNNESGGNSIDEDSAENNSENNTENSAESNNSVSIGDTTAGDLTNDINEVGGNIVDGDNIVEAGGLGDEASAGKDGETSAGKDGETSADRDVEAEDSMTAQGDPGNNIETDGAEPGSEEGGTVEEGNAGEEPGAMPSDIMDEESGNVAGNADTEPGVDAAEAIPGVDTDAASSAGDTTVEAGAGTNNFTLPSDALMTEPHDMSDGKLSDELLQPMFGSDHVVTAEDFENAISDDKSKYHEVAEKIAKGSDPDALNDNLSRGANLQTMENITDKMGEIDEKNVELTNRIEGEKSKVMENKARMQDIRKEQQELRDKYGDKEGKLYGEHQTKFEKNKEEYLELQRENNGRIKKGYGYEQQIKANNITKNRLNNELNKRRGVESNNARIHAGRYNADKAVQYKNARELATSLKHQQNQRKLATYKNYTDNSFKGTMTTKQIAEFKRTQRHAEAAGNAASGVVKAATTYASAVATIGMLTAGSDVALDAGKTIRTGTDGWADGAYDKAAYVASGELRSDAKKTVYGAYERADAASEKTKEVLGKAGGKVVNMAKPAVNRVKKEIGSRKGFLIDENNAQGGTGKGGSPVTAKTGGNHGGKPATKKRGNTPISQLAKENLDRSNPVNARDMADAETFVKENSKEYKKDLEAQRKWNAVVNKATDLSTHRGDDGKLPPVK